MRTDRPGKAGTASATGAGRWLPVLAAVAAVAALLFAFERVVRFSVQQAGQRKAAEAVHDAAVWRCKSMPARQARTDCLLAQL
jgi:hypothetical protein